MAETPLKRLREESHEDPSQNSKRHKPYNNIILNLLDEEEGTEPSQEPSHELSHDLSAIFTTLQQELLASSSATFDFDSSPSKAAAAAAAAAEQLSHHRATAVECGGGGDENDDGVNVMMRHLFEASDDELGIPNNGRDENNNIEILNNKGENFPFSFTDDGLWELEDEAANYYTVLQSELFM